MAGYTDSLGICERISLPGIRSFYGSVSCPVSCFRAGGDYGGFYGGQFVMMLYITCVIISLASLGQLSGWSGERICWRMLIWMHTRHLAPTLFSYYSAYVLYDNAEELVNASLSLKMMNSSSVMVIVFFCYFFSAERYYQYRKRNQQHEDITPD